MANNPIRRSQLIAPFGVGAMLVVQGGIGLLTAGLDHWYEREDGTKNNLDLDEYIIEEWRLQKLLQVDHFRLPPDYREPWRYDGSVPNIGLTVPFHRFPRWHFCPRCDLLDERPLSERGRPKCPECQSDLFQVPFVSMCEAGHLQDFPWREWVHRQLIPTCMGTLRLKATGSASLSGQKVKCDECNMERTLSQIMTAYPDGSTFLSKELVGDGTIFYCPGYRTWLGEDAKDLCTAHLRGSLRSAANVYFAQIRSSIYLPRGNDTVSDELINLLSNPPLSTVLKTVLDALGGIAIKGNLERAVESMIRQERYAAKFNPYKEDQILRAAYIAFGDRGTSKALEGDDFPVGEDDLRREEFAILQTPIDEELLSIKQADLKNYERDITQYFSRIMLLDKLRETRAMTGFTRVFATNGQSLSDQKAMLRKTAILSNNWLPAYVVYGEGIFFEFDEERVISWEGQPEIIDRIQNLDRRYRRVQQNRRLQAQLVTPRFVLLHTFAHILMNRLTFECGYSSAALRERLYVSNDPERPMAGVLIYTADGDAEGTMGGLVRMGKGGYIEPVIRRALQDATWCSADPVCTEIGGSGGQGPDSCNLAACHNCTLVPETACEHFNRFLDRVAVVGDITRPEIGYFQI
ncbi:MAG: DUF1998 domain-containing protein [Anaerolineae bacterium]|nr:DUF1998 domain-containing protein [Anaerolineae bacterium]